MAPPIDASGKKQFTLISIRISNFFRFVGIDQPLGFLLRFASSNCDKSSRTLLLLPGLFNPAPRIVNNFVCRSNMLNHYNSFQVTVLLPFSSTTGLKENWLEPQLNPMGFGHRAYKNSLNCILWRLS